VGQEVADALTAEEVELLQRIPPASQTEEGMAIGTGAVLSLLVAAERVMLANRECGHAFPT
jgi:hypothetical protein